MRKIWAVEEPKGNKHSNYTYMLAATALRAEDRAPSFRQANVLGRRFGAGTSAPAPPWMECTGFAFVTTSPTGVYLVGRSTRFRQELFCAPRAENRYEMLLGEHAAAVQKQFADENAHLVLLVDELFAAGQ